MPHIVIRSRINGMKASSLIDGASGSEFLSTAYARIHNIPLIRLQTHRLLTYADGMPHARVHSMAEIFLVIGDGDTKHVEQRLVYVADLQYDLVLGRPWLADHEPQVRYKSGTLIMDSTHCSTCYSTDLYRPAIALSQEHVHKLATTDQYDRKFDDDDVVPISAIALTAIA
jgi:hypothetical protein